MRPVYSELKIFHFKNKLDSLPMECPDIKAPIHIRIKPTNICNHNCHYCAYRNENLQLGQNMNKTDSIPRDKMMEIIDDLIKIDVKAVTFSGGGEPFCYPHLLEVVWKLSLSSIRFAAITNGSRLYGELAEQFARHAVWLRISMDGWDDDSYARFRGISGNEFSTVMNNLKGFKQLKGKCLLGVSVIVNRENAQHIFDLISDLRHIGVDSVKISPCIVSNDGMENNRYHAPIFGKVREQVERCIRELGGPDFEVYDAYHELEKKFNKDYTWCPYQQILPVIGADLNVYPCQDKAYNIDQGVLGSIRNRSFMTFWFESKDTFFRINPSIHCRHHCVANTKNRMILDYLSLDQNHINFV